MTSAPMARALDLAATVQGSTSPNPWVGCVLVRDAKIIGEGATEQLPGRHAAGLNRAIVAEPGTNETQMARMERLYWRLVGRETR